MDEILFFVRVVLAAIFALAGIGKFLDLKGSEKAVRDFGIPRPLAKPFSVLLPAAEVLIAAALLFIQTSWVAALGATILLTVFIIGMIYQMAKGNAPDCHCFGAIHSEPVSKKSLIRNGIFVILSLALAISGKDNQGLDILKSNENPAEGNIMQLIIGLATVGLLGAVVYFLKTISEQQTQIMRRIEILELTSTEGAKTVEREEAKSPDEGLLIGSPAPDFTLPDLDGKKVSLENLMKKVKPILFFFVSPTCNPCGALLPEIEAWQAELKDKVNFVFISSGKAKDNAEKLGGKTFKQILLQNDREVAEILGAKWTPTALLVNFDGTIGSRPAAGDAAIRELVEKIKDEVPAKKLLYVGNEKNPKIGAEIPDFSLASAGGETIKSNDLRGRKTLLTYWSNTCGYCTRMLEELREWDKTKGQDEPNLLLLSSGDVEANRGLNLNSPIILDDKSEIAGKLGMNGTPSAILIDEHGRIISDVAVGAPQIWTLLGKQK